MEFTSSIINRIKSETPYSEIIPEIIEIIKLILTKNTIKNKDKSIKLIKDIGLDIKKECPTAFPIFNILSRVIFLINQKNKNSAKLTRIFTQNSEENNLESEMSIKQLEIINDLNEIEHVNDYLTSIANTHVNEGETILVHKTSKLIEQFITDTFEEKNFFLIVVETDKTKKFEKLKTKNVLYMNENSVYSIMPKVSKVFIDCHALMADGSLIAESGAFNIAMIAKEFAVPLYVLSPIFKFTPLYAFSQDSFNLKIKPQKLFKEADGVDNLDIIVNKFSLIPSEYVAMVITENGEYSMDYVYRVFSEYYNDSDYGYAF